MELAQRQRVFTRTGTAAIVILVLGLLFLRPLVARAAELLEGEIQFVLNTFSFLIWGSLVMWMCAGFTMLESGAVRTKNASMICLKNIGIYSIAGLAYFVIGYNLMYIDVGDLIGRFALFYGSSSSELALLGGSEAATAEVVANGYAVMSDWFFQMVFVATTASIVSGAIAERVNMWSFFLFTLILTAFIYPVVGAWTWGGGWLDEMGFVDFAGSTIVHGTGGWAAAGRTDRHRTPARQVPQGRQCQAHSAVQRAGRDPGCIHPVVGMVRIQRRITVGTRKRPERGSHEQRAGEHQPGGRRWGGGCSGGLTIHPRPYGSVRRAERSHRRAGSYHRGAQRRQSPVGDPDRRDRRDSLYGWHQDPGEDEDRRCGRRGPRPLAVRHLGNLGGQHRGGC